MDKKREVEVSKMIAENGREQALIKLYERKEEIEKLADGEFENADFRLIMACFNFVCAEMNMREGYLKEQEEDLKRFLPE